MVEKQERITTNSKTNKLGDIAVGMVASDLMKKGYNVFIPLSGYLPFDLIACKENKIYRLQVKYSSYGNLKNGSYKSDSFDYYAVYLPEVDTVIYPSIKFAGKRIFPRLCNDMQSYYYYEDFLDFTDDAEKRTNHNYKRGACGPVKWPSKEKLQKLLWEKPTVEIAKQLSVSDSAINKRCRKLNLKKPPRGYWAKEYSEILWPPNKQLLKMHKNKTYAEIAEELSTSAETVRRKLQSIRKK